MSKPVNIAKPMAHIRELAEEAGRHLAAGHEEVFAGVGSSS